MFVWNRDSFLWTFTFLHVRENRMMAANPFGLLHDKNFILTVFLIGRLHLQSFCFSRGTCYDLNCYQIKRHETDRRYKYFSPTLSTASFERIEYVFYNFLRDDIVNRFCEFYIYVQTSQCFAAGNYGCLLEEVHFHFWNLLLRKRTGLQRMTFCCVAVYSVKLRALQ